MKLRILFVVMLLGGSFFIFSQPVHAADCGNDILKYFPVSKVSSVVGQVLKTSYGYGTCTYSIANNPGGLVSATIRNMDRSVFASSFRGSSLGLGDASSFSPSSGEGAVLKNGVAYSVKWYCYCSTGSRLSESQARALLSFVLSQAPTGTPVPAQPPQPPQIISISPNEVFAGKKAGFNQSTGKVRWGNNFISNFKILGRNLQGSSVLFNGAQNSIGNPIYIISPSVSADGTQITGTLVTQDSLGAGDLIVSVANKNGTATAHMTIDITGDQYLNRAFKNQGVVFLGEWPEKAPNSETAEIEKGVNSALAYINMPSYKKLNLQVRIYAKDYWLQYAEEANCDTRGLRSGCSNETDNIIHAAWISKTAPTWDKLGSTILHEAAHKLNDYYGPSFAAKWNIISQSSNCVYAPPRYVGYTGTWWNYVRKVLPGSWFPTTATWNDGSAGPRCGYSDPWCAVGGRRCGDNDGNSCILSF